MVAILDVRAVKFELINNNKIIEYDNSTWNCEVQKQTFRLNFTSYLRQQYRYITW